MARPLQGEGALGGRTTITDAGTALFDGTGRGRGPEPCRPARRGVAASVHLGQQAEKIPRFAADEVTENSLIQAFSGVRADAPTAAA